MHYLASMTNGLKDQACATFLYQQTRTVPVSHVPKMAHSLVRNHIT